MLRKLLLCALLILGSGRALSAEDIGTVPPADPPFYALTGATVAVGNGQALENATLVIRDGLIESVTVGGEAPAGAWRIDASGMFVYPGLIDALNGDVYKSPTPTPPSEGEGGGGGRRGGPPQATSPEGPGYFAHISASDHLETDDKKLSSWRESGVLTLNAAPTDGIFRGRTALVNLNGKSADEMIVLADTALNMSFQSMGFRDFPGSLMGVLAHIRQTLSDAAHYQLERAEYEKNPRGMKRPKTDRTLEALQPVVDGRLPMILPGKTKREIERALQVCQEAEARCVVAGGFEAPDAAERLKASKTPVLLSLNYPKAPRDQHPDAEESLQDLEYRLNASKAAGRLQEAGVTFAFYSDGASGRDFLPNIRAAVEKGLPKDAALRAATLGAAEILGAEQQLGSLEAGKIANAIVADRDLFDEKAQIRHVFVDGIHHEIPAREEKKKEESGKPANLTGNWDAVVNSPMGEFKMTFSLQQDGEALEGSVNSPHGSRPIFEGSMSGSTFSFKMETDFGGTPSVVNFSGTVEGDRISGSASLGQMGSAPMEARRVP